MIENTYWLNGIWNTDKDFLWSDVSINNFDNLKETDKIWVTVNQWSWAWNEYRSACTIISTYSAILSYFNMKEKKEDKKFILDYCVKNWYNYVWWTMLEWTKYCIKAWNELYPDKKMMYVRCDIWDDFFLEITRKWYCVLMWLYWDSEYSKQRWLDWVITLRKTENKTGWHQISTYYKKEYTHLNTYPLHENNEYRVLHLLDLVNDWCYDKYWYAVLPLWNYSLDNLKQKKKLQQINVMSILTAKTSLDETEKKTLMEIYNKTKLLLKKY